MTNASPVLGLPYIAPSQAQKHVTHNEALLRLDAIVQLSVADSTLTTPPVVPANGDRYIVAVGATGDWVGQDSSIAYWQENGWLFVTPNDGWKAYDVAAQSDIIFANGAWGSIGGGTLGMFGINTTADAVNRLAVAGDATLLNNDGSGHQLKINKATAPDTASLLFQTGFSGRAEMGLTGTDDFAIKVSADGAVWTDAMRFMGSTGHVTGEAVQSSATDTTAGRLARADYVFGPGNLLGTVSETSGTPTGAVIERGSDANGSYVRFADGTQICTHVLQLDYSGSVRLTGQWTFARPFAVDPVVSAIVDLADMDMNATPSPDEVGDVRQGFLSPTICAFWLYKIKGMTAFAVADTCLVSVTATGRWF